MGVSFTSNIDLAQVVLYLFWAFFAGLIFYLHRENKREGYPLLSDRTNARVQVVGFPAPPAPKTYLLAHGGTVTKPGPDGGERPVAAVPVGPWPGAPLTPTGNPMLDGVGPAAWANRADVPDLTHEGDLKILPLRAAPDFSVEAHGPDPRGMTVIAGDREPVGRIVDAWVDRSEFIFRYYEVELDGSGQRVLAPVNFCSIDAKRRNLHVDAIFADQFSSVPMLKQPEQVTILEEEKICAYYGGGTLYAHPRRTESLL
jgi:photosynthetic reaction center H subunit